jgi:DNA-binding LytR/AlgR family response regulator
MATKAISIYIVEDEIITREALKECLLSFGYEVCGAQSVAIKALEEISQLKPDLVFLDINLKGEHSGIWIGQQLNIPFIYLTAFNDGKTIEAAAGTKPSAYLIKPFQNQQVFAAVSVAISLFEKSERNQPEQDTELNTHYNLKGELVIKDGYTHYKIQLQSILFIKTVDKYIYVHTKERRYVLRSSLSQFLEEYKLNLFIRIHKSFAVNKQHIVSFTSDQVNVAQDVLPLSRAYKKDFLLNMSLGKS